MRDLLYQGIVDLGLSPDDTKIDKLINYTRLLLKWNKTYSLTNITDTKQIPIPTTGFKN